MGTQMDAKGAITSERGLTPSDLIASCADPDWKMLWNKMQEVALQSPGPSKDSSNGLRKAEPPKKTMRQHRKE